MARIVGTNQNDTLIEARGADEIFGLDGNDQILLNVTDDFGGDNFVDAGRGDDVVIVTRSNGNVILLGEGNDTFEIGGDTFLPGLNDVDGGAGDDRFAIGSNEGIYKGGAGNDLFVSEAFRNQLDGGEGTDTVSYEISDSSINADLLAGTVFTGANLREDVLNFENLTGSAFADTIFGSAGGNVLNGGAGNDGIAGDAGNDTIDGGLGADFLQGDAGDDTFVVDSTAEVVFERAAEGTDTVRSGVSHALSANVEHLVLTGNAVSGTGNGLGNAMLGNALANALSGGAGNDTINGGAGADTMAGGTGDDAYIVDSAADVTTELAGAGIDRVTTSVSLMLGANIENMVLSGTAAINGGGNALANAIFGNAAANLINGGLGTDVLTGGAGADSFAFNTTLGAGNVDRIADFSVVDDRIMLDDRAFTGIGVLGALGADRFVVGSNATDAADRIVYEQATGKLFFDADGSGAGAKVQFATVTAGTALTSLDFVVF